MDVIIYQVDAFTSSPFGGNPAGVVPDAKDLSEIQMQNIAKEMNLSETAFVIPKDKNNFKVRFFTPKCEVDLCGHATIATFYTLAHKGYIDNIESGVVKIHQETRAGNLPVEIYFKDGMVEKVMMQQGHPKSLGYIDNIDELCEAFNITSKEVGLQGLDIKPEIISTGLPDIILPLKSKVSLDCLNVDFKKVEEISNRLNVTGIHAFAIDNNGDIYCRNFAPAVGIDEEAATGTANGALIYYLKKNNGLTGTSTVVNQGQSLDRPSKIHCQIDNDDGNEVVKVGGRAAIVIEGVFLI